MARGQAFLDSVLVRTGKSREHEFTTVRMARVDWQLVAVLDGADNRIDVRKIQSGIDTLAVEIQCQSHKVDVTRALAVAEQASFDTICTGHDGKLRRSHGTTTVVMRMHRQHDAVAGLDMAAEPLDLVGIDVWRCHLDSRRQIENDGALRCRLPYRVYGITDFHGKIEFRTRETLRGILKYPVGLRLFTGAVEYGPGALHCDVHDAGLVQAEHHPALNR